MSNSNRSQNTRHVTSTPPVIDLDSTNDSSIEILDNSSVEDTLLAGGDNNRRRLPLATPIKNSNDFILNEALATSTPATQVDPATPTSDGKRKRTDSEEFFSLVQVEDDDSGQEGSDEESFSSMATDKTVSASTRESPPLGDGSTTITLDDTISTTEQVEQPPRPGNKPAPGTYDEATGMVMPDTVTVLVTPEGSRVYLVGTAHFSKESQDDVSMVIRAVRPHIVCLELCKARTNILQLDEKTILEEAKNINFDKVRHAIQQNGVVNGLMYVLLLNMSAHLTRELGMAPGGEFRRALAEVQQLNSPCLIHLSDRPLKTTIKRALHSLSWWQTAKLTWHLVMSKEPISKEDVERCKQRDLLEQMLKEMAGEFPQLGTVFVHERDIYLAHSLRLAAMPDPNNRTGESMRVVGVVGIGHVPGIVAHWDTVREEDVEPLNTIPPPSRSSVVAKATFKVALVGVALWAAYRLLPRPRFLAR